MLIKTAFVGNKRRVQMKNIFQTKWLKYTQRTYKCRGRKLHIKIISFKINSLFY